MEVCSDVDAIDSHGSSCDDDVDSCGELTDTRKNGFKVAFSGIVTRVNGKMSNSLCNGHVGGQDISKSQPVAYPIDSVQWLCYELAVDVIEYMSNVNCGRNSPKSSRRSHHSKTIIRTVDELSGKHEILFRGMMNKLQLDRDSIDSIFINVVDAIFADNMYNWGRVVTVYAFAGWLARHCVNENITDIVPRLSTVVGQYIAVQLGPWVTKSGGWDAFEKFFEKPESSDEKIWKGLLYTIFGLGVGAVATAIVVK